MTVQRLDVRLDEKERRKLIELARRRGSSISELVRDMINALYEADLKERRREAARRLTSREIEDVPDPETLKRQILSAYDVDLR